MAHANKVIRSINQPGDHHCIDIFQRPDGSFGFDEYRREPEDPSGWRSVGGYGARLFGNADQAFAAARVVAPWIGDG